MIYFWLLWSCEEFQACELTVAGEGQSAPVSELTEVFRDFSKKEEGGQSVD